MTNEPKNVPELRFPEFEGEWDEKRLGEIGEFKKSYAYSRSSEGEGSIRHIHYGDIHSKLPLRIDNKNSLPTITENKNFDFLQKGDIVFADASEDYKDLGKAVLFNISTQDVIAGLHTHVFRVNNQVASEFLINCTKSIRYYKFIKKQGTGISVLGISKKSLSYFYLGLPEYNEQQKIGNFFSKLDRQIELEEKKLVLLEQQKRGYMQKIFSQGLRFKDENGNDYPNWKTTELKDILEKIVDNRGKTPDNAPSEKYPLLEVNALGYYHPSYKKVSKFVSENTYSNWFREHLKENDILFSTVGNTGIVSLMDNYKAVIAQNIVGLRVNNNNIASFVYYMLSYWENQKKIKRIQMGAVQPSVKVSQFKFIKYLIPIKDEQEKIANLLSEIDKVINKQLIKIELLEQRKKGLLQKMFI